MKSTRATLLSALIALGSFMPVKASDNNPSALASTGSAVTAVADTVTRAFWQNPYVISCGGVILIVGTAAITWFAKDKIDNKEIARDVALSEQESKNRINERNNTHRHEQENQRTADQLMTRYKTVRDKLKHFKNIESLTDKQFLEVINRAAGNPYEPIEDVLTTLNFYLNTELNNFPNAFPFNNELETLKQDAELIKNKLLSTPLIAQERLNQRKEESERLRKNAEIKRLESIATYEQLQAQQKKEELEQQRHLHDKTKQQINDLLNRQSTFEDECKKTLNTLKTGIEKQTTQIQRQQETLNSQQAFISEQYNAVITNLKGLATSEQVTTLTNKNTELATAVASLSKALGSESTLMKTLAGIQQNQNAQSAQLSTQNNKLDAQSIELNELRKTTGTTNQIVAKLDEKRATQASMSNPANWDARKSTTPTPAASRKDDPAKEMPRLDPMNEIAD